MKYIFALTLLILVLFIASLSIEGKNCKKDRCIPTATPTVVQQQIVFYPNWYLQASWTGAGYICRLHGYTVWFACEPYSVKLHTGQTLYGFIRL